MLTLYNPYEFAVRYKGDHDAFLFCYQTAKKKKHRYLILLCSSAMHSSTNLFYCRTSRGNSSTTFSRHVRNIIATKKKQTFNLFIFRVVRLIDTSSSSSNQNVVHKIRIQYFDRRKPQDLIGKRDITCTILSYKPFEENFDDEVNNSSIRTRTANTTTTTTTNLSQQETRKLIKIFI